MDETGQGLEELDTPFLWVDLDRLEENIAGLSAFFRQARVGWRPHFKGLKVPAVARKAIAAGAIGMTCAKLGEAEVLAAAGVTDILVANQLVGRQKIERLVALRERADVKVAVDDSDNVRAIGKAASWAGKGTPWASRIRPKSCRPCARRWACWARLPSSAGLLAFPCQSSVAAAAAIT
jgi:D-serine deaminase-like pyridoxal phosphate-dependent protein